MDDGTGDERREYARSLRELRRNIGCTPQRLLGYHRLLEALRRRLSQKKQPTTIEACFAELKEVVAGLNDRRHREPLMVALRFDPRYDQEKLKDRRTGYNEQLRRDSDAHVESLRTLERRENDGIEMLCRLLAGEGEEHRPEEKGAPIGPGAPANLATEAVAQTCYFSASGAIVRNDIRVSVRAADTETEPEMTVGFRYFSESRPGVLRIEPVFGCAVTQVKENSVGGILATLKLHKSLSPDDGVYVYAYSVVVDSDAPSEPVLRWTPLAEDTNRIEFHLVFDSAKPPTRAWWFRTMRNIEGQMAPSVADERHLEILDNNGYVYKIFEGRPLAALHHYGVAWDW
jgi:hypothetical protein